MKQNEETTATQKKNVVNKNGLEFVIVEIPRTQKKYRIGTLQNSQLDALAKLLIGKDGQDSSAMDEDRVQSGCNLCDPGIFQVEIEILVSVAMVLLRQAV